ncbi:MAG: prolyl oligopeptidase family serine peptidase [Acidobacteria bacterium]|uniref:Prolyl oligopeptidase family serine peptidase n=1 Tax=Candidatus Polarisedimenticola svalbardensis TaxID=2886004 RepID=A0A8J6XQ72_9BACT|nr:prolyl oligopeptidase family serine peptidase [Candidatus Polarisedimenticola svalbardensis]
MTLYRRPRVWKKRLALAATAVLIPYVAIILYFSHFMVSPPRMRVSESSRPVLGVFMEVDRDREGEPGVPILRTVDPARVAGLQSGDVILRVNDLPVYSNADVADVVRAGLEGDLVRVEARRVGEDGETAILLDVPLAFRPVSPADHGLLYQDVAFTDPLGRTLRGWYVPPPAGSGSSAPGVVYGHGNGGDRRHWLAVAREVHHAGVAQLFFDFAGRGESEGKTISLGDRESGAMIAGLEFLASLNEVSSTRIGLAGRSMGGAAAAIAAGRDPRVRALVLDSPFTDLTREVDHALAGYYLPPVLFRAPILAVAAMRGRFEPSEVVPVASLDTYHGPVLLYHGRDDEAVPMTHALEFKERVGDRLELHLLDDTGHNGRRPAPYALRIGEFLKENL